MATDSARGRPGAESIRRVSDMLIKASVRRDYQPASVSEIAAELTGTHSTHVTRPPARTRAALSVLEDRALRSLWRAAVATHGPERAAYIVFRMTSRGGQPPEWLVRHFRQHPEALRQAAEESVQ